MGIGDYPFVYLIQRVKSWFGSVASSLEMAGYCFNCQSFCDGGQCRSCGRFLCTKHVQAGFDQPVFCKSCFPAANSPQSIPDSPLLRFRDSRLSHLSELSSLSSPRSSRSDEEEDGDDGGKNIFGSDVDSVSISISTEIQSLKSVHSSPLDSPSIGGETTRDNSPLDQEAPSYFRKTGAESEDSLDSLSVYRGQETQNVQQPLDFENNRLIWDPPLPEDENDDLESGFFGYDDEDDDGGGDSYNKFSFGSFSSHSFSTREKPSDGHKEQLRNSVHGHFRALVCQLLRGEGLQVGSEDAGQGWLDIVSSLAWQAATFAKPDISKGGSMDPGNYVKVKCLLSGRPSDSTLVKGVVCTKNIKHKRMVSQYKNPRLFLLGGALEYERVTNKLASINAVLEQEIDHLKKSISKIEAHRPNVLLVEKTVSSYAQQCLLAKEISLVLNVKRTLLERIARCTGAQIAPTIDNIGLARLGHCGMFRVERFFEDCSSGSHPNKKAVKTLMFFEGCPRRLGCTVLLRGTYAEELKKVKHVVQYATFAACHLSRETSFLADEGATLPKVPINSSLAVSAEVLDADATILKTSTSPVLDAHKNLSSCSNDAITVSYQSSNVMSLHGDISTSNNNQLVGDVAVGSKEPCDQSDFATDVRTSEEVMGHTPYEGKELKLHKEHGTANEGKKAGISCENESIDHSTADSHSILVSLSTTCVLKGTVCEPSQLFRIKFYSSFDKPLGRYICDDLFHQTSSCRSCNGPAEAHVRFYTHQHGSLTISVHRHPSVRLPGVRDGRIWMWHRCLKCEQDNGVPPAARRVVMSDAAWGLSFGKFLELSFSNHAAANRVASCGHSLQKDCLRFYGSGSMVAFFRYSPVDILSVQLPPLVLDFVCQSRQERAEGEAACILNKLEFMHAEVNGVLQGIEQRTSEHEPLKGSIHKYILELKELLKRERNEYDTLLQQYTDILQLNRLRRFLLIDSHMWDRRLCLLDSFYKSKTSTSKLQSSQKEWQVESIGKYGKFRILPEEVIPNISTLSNQKDLFLRASECVSNNLVDLDDETGTISETCIGNSSLERLPSAASALSDKIDSLWSGDPEADVIGSISLLDNPLCKKVILPIRVNSFDSALRSRERLQGGLSSGSLHLNSVKSFNASGNFTSTNISEGYSRLKRLNFHPSHNPVFISSPYHIVGEGARLLLPQTGPDGIVIVLYDNEPTTIISYAISSQNHADFIASDYQLSYGSIGNPSISQSHSEEATHFRISFDDMSSIPNNKVKFSVTCYFAKQFASLRKKCCPREADFLTSLSRCKRWNAQGGKSSVYFAKSFDERFILKQVTKTELDSFVVFAPEYFKYMTGSLNTGSPTCLAKVLGIYQVTVRHLNGGREVKMDLMVMENLFFGKTLSKVYDLKGSLRARYNPDTSGNDNVLLDMNLLESLRTKPIFLGSKAKRSLERAVWNDTSFLASVDVMDYSLLVGVDEGRKELVIGIIDYMRQYTWDKHLETWVKAAGILGGSKNESPTVVSPLQYKKRFRKAMSKYFLTVPDQWSSHR